jgi:serine protease Do
MPVIRLEGILRAPRHAAPATITAALGALLASGVANAQNVSVPAPGEAVPQLIGFADMVERVSPAVVSIQIAVERQFTFGGEPVTRIDMGQASGFIISGDGYVVTNDHVVDDAQSVAVVLADGARYPATVIGGDPETDIALLKIDAPEELPYLTLSQDDPRVGDWVIAIGNPFGLGGSVTAGIVSARGRSLASVLDDFLQIDASINLGSSGGPAFNILGQVVGVNSAIASSDGDSAGVAFAVPAYVVADVVADLMEDGDIDRGFLGVFHLPVTPDVAEAVGLDRPYGAIVGHIIEGAPSIEAGLRPGDVIVAVDGEIAEDNTMFGRLIAFTDPGETAELTVWRDGAEISIATSLVTREEVPAGAAPEGRTPAHGVETEAGEPGLAVQAVADGSPVADAGLAVGDVILDASGLRGLPWVTLTAPDQLMDIFDDAWAAAAPTVLLRVAGPDGVTRIVAVVMD